jgi:hypothetical protein
MKRQSLIHLLQAGGKTEPQAADELDRAVEHILRRLRKGQVVALPGIGRLVPGRRPAIQFEKSQRRKGGPRG